MNSYNVIIIGGGASGLAAAITLKRKARNLSVAILEKKDKVGCKLAATGNGKCNLSNSDCPGAAHIIDFFASMGVPVRKDSEGRIYPYSESAAQVVDALHDEATALGVDIICHTAVSDIKVTAGGKFEITPGYIADRVVIATGGKSYAAYGTTGDGYVLARNLGHTITPLVPGLTAIEVDENIQKLRGIRAKGKAGLYKNGQLIAMETGEIQFREDSLSGICIMNLSNMVKRDAVYDVLLNLVPDFPNAKLEDMYSARALLKPELMEYIRSGNLDPRALRFRVRALKGWNEAQITCGGVSLDEVDMATMESMKVPGLYFTGEVLDIQEQCGGYNLNNAWVTGIRAGEAISDKYF